jgi:hypothetical protein
MLELKALFTISRNAIHMQEWFNLWRDDASHLHLSLPFVSLVDWFANHFILEDGDSMLLQNVVFYQPVYSVPKPKELHYNLFFVVLTSCSINWTPMKLHQVEMRFLCKVIICAWTRKRRCEIIWKMWQNWMVNCYIQYKIGVGFLKCSQG